MGNRGRNWMESDYGWNSVAEEMNALYQKLLTCQQK
jgi:glycogen synthase